MATNMQTTFTVWTHVRSQKMTGCIPIIPKWHNERLTSFQQHNHLVILFGQVEWSRVVCSGVGTQRGTVHDDDHKGFFNMHCATWGAVPLPILHRICRLRWSSAARQMLSEAPIDLPEKCVCKRVCFCTSAPVCAWGCDVSLASSRDN